MSVSVGVSSISSTCSSNSDVNVLDAVCITTLRGYVIYMYIYSGATCM